ncbi:Uncharacterized protein HZ326_17339 [Fusarium oxysporum f. sp. albedinis]|nr:Uncharacterized protein HZ326_17339 [Fusarium oxysporum f. sp. albedinis]
MSLLTENSKLCSSCSQNGALQAVSLWQKSGQSKDLLRIKNTMLRYPRLSESTTSSHYYIKLGKASAHIFCIIQP